MQVAIDFPLEIVKRLETKSGDWIIEGFAGTTDLDLQGDIITPKCFAKAEKDLIGVTLLFNHDQNQPLGQIIDTRATEEGLWIKSRISHTVPERWKQVQDDTITKYSIRGFVIDAHKAFVKEEGRIANIVSEMRLIEASLVTVPGNPSARKIRSYIQKALQDFESKGGEIHFKQEGGANIMGSENAYLAEADFLDTEKILTGLIEGETDPEKRKAFELLMEKTKKRVKKEEEGSEAEKAAKEKAEKEKKEKEEKEKIKIEQENPKKKSEESYDSFGKRVDGLIEKAKKDNKESPYTEKKKDESFEDFGRRIEAGLTMISEKAWIWVDKALKDEIERKRKPKAGEEGEKYPYAKKDSYSQEEVNTVIKAVEEALSSKQEETAAKIEEKDSMIGEKDRLLNEANKKIDESQAKLKNINADVEVEKEWIGLKDSFEEKDASAIKKILKKSILGEILTAGETLSLVQKKKGESLKVGSEFSKSIEGNEKKSLIKEFGIKTRIEN